MAIRRNLALIGVLALSGAGGAAAFQPQVPPPPPPPVRDISPPAPGGPNGPQPRTVPIGTAALTGVVTAADTGRPIRGARVAVGGTVAMAPRTGGPGPAGAASIQTVAAPGGMTGGVISGLSRTAVTDAQGRFVIQRLPAGRFGITVTSTGYLNTTYGQKKPGGRGQQVQLADGQQTQVSLALIRGGVIAGTVIGADGEPETNAQVRVFRYAVETGVKRLQSANAAATDDRGMYRVHGLQPGDYIVAAQPNSADLFAEQMANEGLALEQAIASGAVRPPPTPGFPATVALPSLQNQMDPAPQSYLPTFHPNTTNSAESPVIHVTGGDEHAGVDIQVQLARSSTIVGTLSTAMAAGVGVQVSLQLEDPNAFAYNLPGARVQDDGHFTMPNVMPGRYIVSAYTVPAPIRSVTTNNMGAQVSMQMAPASQGLDASQKFWARVPVVIDGSAPTTSVVLVLQPGRTIAGRVQFDVETPPNLATARVTASINQAPGVQNQPPIPPPAPIGPDGSFVFNGVLPGKYILRAGGGTVKTSMVDSQDTLDAPLDFQGDRDITDALVTVTDKISEISGTLTDATGKPGVEYSVLAVSADPRFWRPLSRRIQMTGVSSIDGTYTFRNLPPGDYLVAAVSDLDPGGQYDPELLKSLASASMRVTVTEGGKVTQNLQVAR